MAITAIDRPLLQPMPLITTGLPVMYEDDEEGDMGESNPHVDAEEILHVGVGAHLAGQPQYAVYRNLNLHYDPRKPRAYASPDGMVVTPPKRLPVTIASYRIGVDGPAPIWTGETLSKRSYQQQDLGKKVTIYAKIGVLECVLIDTLGMFLPQRLLLKRLLPNRTWSDEQDADGGVTSRLGFRLIIEDDDRLRVVDVLSGRRYLRPDEAEQRIRQLEAEVALLRKGRRKKN